MKKVVTLLGIIVAVLGFYVYGTQYLLFHQTKISDEEILISRIGAVPWNRTKYAVNLETGDEKISIYSPFGQTWFINYGGKCRCITTVSKVGSYRVSLAYKKGKVYYSTGETVHKTVPYEQKRYAFEEGMTIRNEFRERHADLLPS